MQDLFFDKGTHTYYYKGEQVPCVSDVLKMVDTVLLAGIPQRNLEIAAERGSRVHVATEDLEYGVLDIEDEEWLEENADIQPYLIAYKKFLDDHPAYSTAREEALYSERLGYAGTLDIVKQIGGRLSVVDIKTSRTIGGLRSALQLSAYQQLWNENHADNLATDLYILQLKDNAQYRLLPIKSEPDTFLSLYELYNRAKGDVKL